MAQALKTFIVTEQLHREFAERLVTYTERYSAEVTAELREKLTEAWRKELPGLNSTYVLTDEERVSLQPDESGDISINAGPIKLQSTKFRASVEVYPSARIPVVRATAQRAQITKIFLDRAEEVCKALASSWREIFYVEAGHRLREGYKLVREHDTIRLQLIGKLNDREHVKTLYSINVDYARPGRRNRDLLYLYVHEGSK